MARSIATNRQLALPVLPTELAGLALWLDASQISGLSDGDPVTTWSDASGQGNHSTQATTSQKPTYKTGIVNGKPVVRFDGVDDNVQGPMTIGPTISVFAVASRNNGNDYYRIFSNEINVFIGAQGGNFASFYGNGSTWGEVLSHGADAAMIPSTFYVLASINDGTDNAYLNGALVGSRSNPMAAFSNGYIVGYPAGQVWNKDVAELIVYDSALSTPNRQLIECYLSGKYGITLS